MLTCLRLSPVQLAAGQYRDPPDTPDPPPPEIWIGSYPVHSAVSAVLIQIVSGVSI